MDIVFVPVKPEEAQELSDLRRRAWSTTYRGIFPDEMIDHFDYAFHNERNRMILHSENYAVYFLVYGTENIGYLTLRKKDPLRLQSLYLLEEYRRKGIGTMAFRFVRDYCREHRISHRGRLTHSTRIYCFHIRQSTCPECPCAQA